MTMTGSDGYEYETFADRLIGKKADTDFNWHLGQFKDGPKEYSREYVVDWAKAYRERQDQGFDADGCVFSAYKYAQDRHLDRIRHSSRISQPDFVPAALAVLYSAH